MSNEHNDNDTLVSSIYRDSAQETTPTDLDDAVLRMAARESRSTGKAALPGWMKPMARAATIGLTLAIVVDITEVSETVQSPAPAPATTSIEEAFSADDAAVVQEAEELARMRDGPDQPSSLAKSRREPEERLDQDVSADAAVASRARGVEPAAAESAATLQMNLEKKESSDDFACEQTARDNAETWFDCVIELRDAGRAMDADREMLRLIEEFPDYRPE